ncbi:wax ester/triacylglycerol synthase domain-containing protein [Streptomyces sp. NPDC002225]|uniref:wax ester/triacylglycerol synthase domain-containing protein n=1 Tax=Streptomyces sp. NPDC002225 TaxID=3154413 RepID=UPI003327922C
MRERKRATPLDHAIQAYPVQDGTDAHSHLGCVLHLRGTPPDADGLRRHLEERLARLPGLRTVLDAWTGRWHTRDPDLALHVQELLVPPGDDALRDAAREVLRTPLPGDVPPWLMALLREEESGRCALVYRVHHAVQDGAGMLHTLEELFSAEPVAPQESSAVYRKAQGVRLSRPGDWLRAGALTLRLLGRCRAWQAPEYRFSTTRDLDCVAVPADWLNPPDGEGGSRNDVFLAATARAVRDWAAESGAGPVRRGEVPMLVPANLRTDRDLDRPGNPLVLAPVRVPAPPAGRPAPVRSATRALRDPAVRFLLDRFGGIMPHRLAALQLRSLGTPSRTMPIVSNLTLRHPLAVLGAEVVRIDPLMCLPQGFPFTVLMITHGGTSVACFVTEPGLPGLATLPGRWRDALDDLRTAGHGTVPDPRTETGTGAGESPDPAPARP